MEAEDALAMSLGHYYWKLRIHQCASVSHSCVGDAEGNCEGS